jgi:hypothetical protein
MGAEMS